MPETCAICLDDVSADNTILPCNHEFCSVCIQDWIGNNSCPVCRAVVNPDLPVQASLEEALHEDDQQGFDDGTESEFSDDESDEEEATLITEVSAEALAYARSVFPADVRIRFHSLVEDHVCMDNVRYVVWEISATGVANWIPQSWLDEYTLQLPTAPFLPRFIELANSQHSVVIVRSYGGNPQPCLYACFECSLVLSDFVDFAIHLSDHN